MFKIILFHSKCNVPDFYFTKKRFHSFNDSFIYPLVSINENYSKNKYISRDR